MERENKKCVGQTAFFKARSFIKNNAFALILTAVFAVLLGVTYVFPRVLSNNYNKVYGNVFAMENGVVDFSDASFNKSIDPKLDGEWEFYYNKWLITDKIDGRTPDAMIAPTHLWTEKQADGTRLPKEGYGSYRLILRNLPDGCTLRVNTQSTPIAWRAFLDGEMISYEGKMSKIPGEDFINVRAYNNPVSIEGGRDYELIVEVSGSELGGLGMPTTVSIRPVWNVSLQRWGYALGGVALGLLLFEAAFSVVFAFSTKRYLQYIIFSLMGLAMVLSLFFSIDYDSIRCDTFPNMDMGYVPTAQYVAFMAGFFLYSAYLFVSGAIKVNKKAVICFVVTEVALIAATVLTVGYKACYPLYATSVGFFGVAVWFLGKNAKGQALESVMRTVLLLSLEVTAILAGMDYLDVIVWGTAQIYSYTTLFTMAMALGLFAIQIVRDYGKAVKIITDEKEKTDVRAQVLKAQIKPHFVFNTLTLIKGNYHKSLEQGDYAINAFAKHLRNNVDADLSDTVPFTRELDNIINYFDLENLRNDNKLTLLIDTDYVDFEVPALSLQPIVENAVKYSQIQYEQDGYIQIKSYLENDTIFVEVSDNGVGFDADEIKPTSVGIRNLSERLKYVLGATVEIESKKGQGTRAVIKIPRKGVEK